MENKEKNPRVVVIDRREDNGVLLTRRIAERYGTETCLRSSGKLIGRSERKHLKEMVRSSGWGCRIQCWSWESMHFGIAIH